MPALARELHVRLLRALMRAVFTILLAAAAGLAQTTGDAVAVNAAGFRLGLPVAPGSLVSVFGAFPGFPTAAVSGPPLPFELQGVDVLIGGRPAPLLFVSPGQINLQLPGALPPGLAAGQVRFGGIPAANFTVAVVPRAPGLFAALNQDGTLNSPSQPARHGDVLQVFGTGQGETAPPVPDGEPAPFGPFALTPAPPDVTIGGRPAAVLFSGLAPGLPGVWQINARIPQDAPEGAAVPFVATYGFASNPLPVAIGAAPAEPGPGTLEGRVFAGINEQRRLQGLPQLVWSEELAREARAHSQAMAERNFFSHDDPVRGSFAQRIQAAGIACGACGENLFMARGFADPVPVAIEGWMNSPGHRANILDARFRRTGIGIAQAADGAVYFTQIFGS